MLIFFSIFVFLILSISICKFSNQKTTTYLLIIFWYICIFLSFLDFHGFGTLQNTTYFIFLFSPLIVATGTIFHIPIRNKHKELIRFFPIKLYIFISVFVAIFFLHSIYLGFLNGFDSLRNSLQNSESGGSLGYIFFTNQIGFLYNMIAPTILMAGIITASTLRDKRDFFMFTLLSSLLLLIDITFLSRIYLYSIIVLFIISYINSNYKISHIKFLFWIFSILSLIFLVTYLRDPDRDFSAIFSIYFLDYHTIGIYLFDQSLIYNNFDSNNFIPLTFSFISFPIEYIYRVFIDSNFIPLIYEFNNWNSIYRELIASDGSLFYYNAFITNIYAFYYDFGIPGVILIALLYGFFLGKFNSKTNTPNMQIFANCLLLYGFLGFFNPMYLTSQSNIIGIILCIYFFHFKNSKGRIV